MTGADTRAESGSARQQSRGAMRLQPVSGWPGVYGQGGKERTQSYLRFGRAEEGASWDGARRAGGQRDMGGRASERRQLAEPIGG